MLILIIKYCYNIEVEQYLLIKGMNDMTVRYNIFVKCVYIFYKKINKTVCNGFQNKEAT